MSISTSLGEFDYDQTGAKDAVDKVSKEGSEMGVNVKTIVKNGSPAHEIIEESKNHDLIVMSSLGNTGLTHLLVGSVAEKVIRFAACPVLVVKSSKKK